MGKEGFMNTAQLTSDWLTQNDGQKLFQEAKFWWRLVCDLFSEIFGLKGGVIQFANQAFLGKKKRVLWTKYELSGQKTN